MPMDQLTLEHVVDCLLNEEVRHENRDVQCESRDIEKGKEKEGLTLYMARASTSGGAGSPPGL